MIKVVFNRMKNLFEASTVAEVKDRMAQLRPDSVRVWGKMTPAQAMAHCAAALELANGDKTAPRTLLGKLIGGMFKGRLTATEAQLGRNSPTAKSLLVTDERDLGKERAWLQELVERFAQEGPQGCTTNPHAFFGPLTPNEWSVLMYKHLDHHLRQFGV
jgi:hypothetical protein